MRAQHMHGSPSREASSISEHNGVLFGLCCSTRRTTRSAIVFMLPNKHFCSAICWLPPCSDVYNGSAAAVRRVETARTAKLSQEHEGPGLQLVSWDAPHRTQLRGAEGSASPDSCARTWGRAKRKSRPPRSRRQHQLCRP